MELLARPHAPPRPSDAALHRLLAALQRLAEGDTAVRLPAEGPGLMGELAAAFNAVAALRARPQPAHAALQNKARLLAHRNEEVERKNREVELARQSLEDKAQQLALASKYKSEFLANMSHELRTPLNSLLILSDQLSKNPEGNLNLRQVEFARTIHASGQDLLMLINDILDLSKIESGTVAVDIGPLRLADLERFVERTFRHVAEARQLEFTVDSSLRPSATMRTDAKRLQQILKNLLSNAFKFTHQGRVRLSIVHARGGWSAEHPGLRQARRVVAFSVSDTGIGIGADKQQIIFEAFQQADGSTSRTYGGTGLGLAISRELSRLLGGEIRLDSAVGRGSTFTLFLPLDAPGRRSGRRAGPPPPEARVAAARRKRSAAPAGPRPVRDPATALGTPPAARRRSGRPLLLAADADADRLADALEAARRAGWTLLAARGGAEALGLAADARPSAVVLGPALSDMPGARLLRRLRLDPAFADLPACVLPPAQWQPARLEGALRALAGRLGPPRPPAAAASLRGLRALVVDDDMRNIFALATVLEEHGMEIVWADNGRDAIQRVATGLRLDVALLDVMMPALDGLATLREIRRLPQGRELPVVAVTAKAMKGDREKCIAAGAWDYLSKPVDTQALLAVLRAWLPPA
ncbi:response regulator [Ramlibacter sp. MAHUQ-53]|uniref:response regulator n=1 Tax=unclassified Ramlibacter TaxID=2617605 RepID=UPI00363D87D3